MKNKIRSMIGAFGEENFVIGDGKKMPKWRLPTDVQFFVDVSMEAGICITGRKNYESLPKKWRPLPGRKMIVVTENILWTPEEDSDDVFVEHSFWAAMEKAEKLKGNGICFIGGGETYRWGLSNLIFDRIHLTTVLTDLPFEGTVTFPCNLLPSLKTEYVMTKNQFVEKDDTHSHSCIINTFERGQK